MSAGNWNINGLQENLENIKVTDDSSVKISEWDKPVDLQPDDTRWCAKVDKIGGWNNRKLTVDDFDDHQRQNRDRRGGYQQGRGQGKGGYQQQNQRGRSRGGYQQQPAGGRGRGDYYQTKQHDDWSNNNVTSHTDNTSISQSHDSGSNKSQPASWRNPKADPSVTAVNKAWNTSAASSSWDKPLQSPSSADDWKNSLSNTDNNSSGWDNPNTCLPSSAVGATSWDQKPQSLSNTASSSWDAKPAAAHSWATQTSKKSATKAIPQPAAAHQQEDEGWNAPSKAETGNQWGTMTMDSLGWTESAKKPKNDPEPGQGIWKDGVHVLGQESPELKLKLFGTAADQESVHSGINFDNYEKIDVEIKGKNVPEGIATFAQSGLDKHLLQNIQFARYTTPTPVQKHSIPIVMQQHDLMACAQTGSGKTAGFLFPILSTMFTTGPLQDPKEPPIKQNYQSYKKSYPQALILAPTRELASQIYNEAKKFCYRSYVRPCVAYGGADIQRQLRLIDRGCHLLVATPGRLVDILERRRLSFKNIQYLVLDEADRMLDMGFEPQVRRIVEGEDMPPPSKRQTLLFSATFPDNIQKLASDFLYEYVFLSVGRVGATSENITQKIELVHDQDKRPRLLEILNENKHTEGLTLIFTETKRMADTVCSFLIDHQLPSTAIHGDRIQSEREAALDSFRKGITPIMVATAVAARGLDIPNVTHVISFDLPNDIDDYVHRIGRTGRAGNTGMATAFFNNGNRFMSKPLVKLLQDANQEVPEWLLSMSQDDSNDPSNFQPTRDRRKPKRQTDGDDIGPRVSSYRVQW